MQQLSKRLQQLVSYVDDECSFIDVAADHGYVALALARKNDSRKMIVSDIAKMPLESGKVNFKNAGIDADFRLGSGLEVLERDENIDVAIIAGIGGRLMVDILDNDINKTKQVDTFVLSANIGMELVRKWLYENKYKVIDDVIVEDDGRFYECIRAQQDTQKDIRYADDESERELQFYFGATLREQITRDNILKEFIQERIEHLNSKIEQLQFAHAEEAKQKRNQYLIKVEKLKEFLE